MGRMDSLNKNTIIWNYIGTFFSMGLQFLILPFLLFFLTAEELGLWYVMLSFSNLSGIFSFGFTPAFARNVAYCWNGAKQLKKSGKEHDVGKDETIDFVLMKKILITSRFLYFLLASLGVGFLAVFGTMHIWKIAADILNKIVIVSWILFLISVFLNIYYGYYSSYLIGIGKVKEANQIIAIAALGRLIVTAAMMFLGYGLVGAASGYLIQGILWRVLSSREFFRDKRLKDGFAEFRMTRIHFREIKECFEIVWYNAWKDGVVSVAEYFSTQINTIVCSSFLTLGETAMFSLIVQLAAAVGKISRSIHNAYTPVFQRAYITGDWKTARESQAFCIFAFTIVYMSVILTLQVIGIPLIRIFKPGLQIDRYSLSGYAIYQFMLSYRNCYGAYLSCTNRLWYWKSYLLTSMATVAAYTAAFVLIGPSVWWVIIISIIGEGLYNFWKWPGLVNEELQLTWRHIFETGFRATQKLLTGKERKS